MSTIVVLYLANLKNSFYFIEFFIYAAEYRL